MNRLLTSALRALGVALYVLRLHPLIMWLHRRSPKVVAFHAFDTTETDYTRGLSINTTPAALAQQLDFLCRHYRVVALDDLAGGAVPDRAVAITIDDGYRSVFENAFPLLRARGLPATVFLIGDAMGTGSLWINDLNRMLRQHPSRAQPVAARVLGCDAAAGPDRIIQKAIARFDPDRIAQLMAAVRDAVGTEAAGDRPAARLFLSWAEVETMAAHGITFGNHTKSHPNLARIPAETQRAEVAGGAAILAGRPGARTDLALPFGLGDTQTEQVAREAGCRFVLGLGGVNNAVPGVWLARVPTAADSVAAFFADLEIVTPARAFLKRVLRAL